MPTPTQKTITRAEFEKLSPAAKQQFFRLGGKRVADSVAATTTARGFEPPAPAVEPPAPLTYADWSKLPAAEKQDFLKAGGRLVQSTQAVAAPVARKRPAPVMLTPELQAFAAERKVTCISGVAMAMHSPHLERKEFERILPPREQERFIQAGGKVIG